MLLPVPMTVRQTDGPTNRPTKGACLHEVQQFFHYPFMADEVKSTFPMTPQLRLSSVGWSVCLS